MRKSLTKFMLGLAATLLFTLPTQAASVTKDFSQKAKPGFHMQKKVASKTVVKKTDTAADKLMMRVKDSEVRLTSLQKAMADREMAKAAFAKGQTPWQSHSRRVDAKSLQFDKTVNAGKPFKGPRKNIENTEEVDEHDIIIKPNDGVVKVYNRSGWMYVYSDNSVNLVEQSGSTQIVECLDGTIYIKDIVASYQTGAWVKGTKVGNTITVPAKQPINYNSQYNATLSPRWASVDAEGNVAAADETADNFTFTVEENTISLQGTSDVLFMAVLWDDDDSFSGNGCFETVYTYSHDYVPPTIVTVTPPAGLETETWYTSGNSISSSAVTSFNGTVTVGFDGNDVYVQGIFSDHFPESWMKGTIEGSTITFKDFQYQGEYDEYPIYGIGTDGEGLTDYVMDYDPVTSTFTAREGNDLLANAADDRIYYLAWLSDLVISKQDNTPKIDELPYVNTFDDATSLTGFTIIDVNDDGKTWGYYASSAAVAYTYSGSNDADDWLISPAIKLEAGKTYRVALDAKNSGYPERFEVKMGTDKTVAAMTTEVIPATDVTWQDAYQTIENIGVTVSETGYYYIGIHAISDADQFRLLIDNFTVEQGADPAAPAAVNNLAAVATEGALEATITFTAPAKALSGDDLTGNLTKIDLYRDGEVIYTFENVTPGVELSYTDNDAALTMGNHTYQVIAFNAAGAGAKSNEATVFLSAVLNVPYTFDLTTEGTFNIFQVIDNNGDGSTWSFGSYGTTYKYNSDNAGDDYLISPAINLEAGKNYKVVVAAKCAGETYPEKFVVLAGKEPTVEALNIVAMNEVTVASAEGFEQFDDEFSVAESGKYYLAVKATSDPDMFRLMIGELSIVLGADPNAPAAITDLVAVAGAEGALQADLTFTAPAKSIGGTDMTENMTVQILRDGEPLTELEGVVPGSTVNYSDASIDAFGTYSYQAIATNSYGTGRKGNKVSVFVGVDIPADLAGLEVADNWTSLTFNWDRVTTGANDGYVDPTKIDYLVWSLGVEESMWGSQLYYDEKLDSLRDATTATIAFNTEEGEQEYKYFAVQPKNEAGEGNPGVTSVFAGKSYELPVIEGFAGQALHYYMESNLAMFISDQSTDGDGVALNLTLIDEEGGTGYIQTGKINLKSAANPTLLFDVKSPTINQVTVYGTVDGSDLVEVGQAPVTENYSTVKLPLQALQSGRYAQLLIAANFATPTIEDIDWTTYQSVYDWGDSLTIDNIKVMDLYEYDLSVNVSAPKSVNAGQPAKIKVTVTNEGENAAQNFIVKLMAGEKELLNETVSESLASWGTKEFEVEYATTIFDEGDVTLSANVEFANDLNPDNNATESIFTIKAPAVPAPTNVVASQANASSNVMVTWNAPEQAEGSATEGFDDAAAYPEFTLGGITAEQSTGSLNGWTLYDGNGYAVYGFEGLTVPNLGNPMAWMVFAPGSSQLSQDLSGSYAAHSGEQFLASFCVAEPENNIAATDHWLISPELSGSAQNISFFARALTEQYGAESFEVLYSTTDKEVASFTSVEVVSTTATEWTEYSFSLPQGTKYFAIRHISTDVFALFIDDITYQQGSLDVEYYNLYVDQKFVAAPNYNETSYEVDLVTLTTGVHSFAVSAVYANDVESKPVTATLDVITAIEEIMASGKPVNVYTLDGKRIGTLNGKKGAYIIDNKKVMVK